MTLQLSHPRAKRRWLLLVTTIVALSLAGAAVAQAALDRTLFELDGDATADTTYTKIAVLNSAVATAADGASTTIELCQNQSAFYNGALVLVDAERMTLSGGANLGGGGCPTGFTFKRSYSALRGVGTTVPGAHAKAEDVSKIDAITGSHDWDEVYASWLADNDTTCESLGAVECTFAHDGRAASVFTQAKDYDEISDTSGIWKWRDQSVPDANELDDGMAIKYIKDGEQFLYFAADRFATNGTKDAGFWFFHDTVAPLPPVGTADGLFSGVHTAPDDGGDGFCNPDEGGEPADGLDDPETDPRNCDLYDNNDTAGDVLVLTTFTGGGAVTTIRVFEWIGPSGSVDALFERGVQGDCVPGSTDQELCATVNKTTIETAWTYDGKGEPADNEVSSGGFLEGGLNLSALGLEGCFSSFMATSRSSAELTADLKDFILGSFEACDTDLTTTPKTGAGGPLTADTDGDNLAEIPIGTDGTVSVKDSAELEVKGEANFTGSLSFYICGPFDNPAACDATGVLVNTIDPVAANGPYVSDAATLTSVGRYCWFGFFDSGTEGVPDASDGTIESGDPNADPPIPSSTGECFEVTPVTPTLTTTAVDCEEVTVEEETTVVCTALTGPVDFGSEVFDEANLTGTAKQPGDNGGTIPDDPPDPLSLYPTIGATNGADADGTITFKLYGPLPDDPGEEFDEACDTLAAGFATAYPDGIAVTVDGDGLYNTFGSGFIPEAPGVYAWKASYSGSPPNTTGAPLDADGDIIEHNADCDVAAEAVTVRQIPTTISTRQRVYPNDAARIASSESSVNLPAGGTVTFRLYVADGGSTAAENCALHGETQGSGGLVYVEQKTLVGGDDVETVSTNNTTYPLTSLTSEAYWWVTYDPNDTAFSGIQSDCAESTSVTFVDHAGPGTLFPPPPTP
jgi:hypothetical protein